MKMEGEIRTQDVIAQNAVFHSPVSYTHLDVYKRQLITSPSGGEITLYRLLPGDVCILSAACMIQSLDVEIQLEMERDSTIAILPSNVFDGLSQEYPVVKSYVLEMISSRFSDVMWTCLLYTSRCV